MSSPQYTLLTAHFVQVAGAVFLAVLLARFHRTYGHAYLREWAQSWAAFAVYVLGGAVGVLWASMLPLQHPVRLLVAVVTLLGGFCHIACALFGAYSAERGDEVPRHWKRGVISAFSLIAVAAALAFSWDAAATDLRFFSRIAVRQGMAALFFTLAGIWLGRRGAWRVGFGSAIVMVTFVLYGVGQGGYFALNVADLLVGYRTSFDLARLGSVDFLLQFAMGVGMVIWLLESERDKLQRTAEALRQSEQRLDQSQRLEAVGQLAGGIAHDFNNLLTVILGRAQMLRDRLPPGSEQRLEAEQINEAAESGAALVRQLLAFSRRQALEPSRTNLNEVVDNVTSMLRRALGEQILLRCDLASDIGVTEVDAPQIEQVLVNLALNARDAMPEGGDLLIETRNVVVGAEESSVLAEIAVGAYVVLVVRDSGSGMDARTKRHIFEPFFTTKETGKGTGLGLSTAYGIIRQSGGHIVVDSAPGCGTEVRVYLPRLESGAVPEPGHEEAPAAEADGGAAPRVATILVVEDEDRIRSLLSSVLRDYGYNVLLAANGEEALALAAVNETPVDLLLTDVVMPGIGGAEIADRLVERWPGLDVLFMSGYSEDVVADSLLGDKREVLEKPFTMPVLLERVRSALEK